MSRAKTTGPMASRFREIETKWQHQWEDLGLFHTEDNPGRKFYLLEMFAYPSGDIHMGHFRNYTIGDAAFRYRMMRGYELLHPFGWDAFGLPAEQAAIERGVDPGPWTMGNISTSRDTLKRIGTSYDWDREVITADPAYYRWTQWLFLELFDMGLCYRDKAVVNWCPRCNTVLANEQVAQGVCWRCGSEVSKRELEQWFFRITAYAERLLRDIDRLQGWPENVKAMQRNWIGRSEGLEIDFYCGDARMPVFTTRPDTVYGVTFMAMAPEHRLVRDTAKGSDREQDVMSYVERSLGLTETERTSTVRTRDGVFTGRTAVNPLSGEDVQIWVADYVLPSYGTGLVMGVPAHDQRDFEFARANGIPVKLVIRPPGGISGELEEAYVDPGIMVNSGPFAGMTSQDGIRAVEEHVEKAGTGRRTVNYRLRDWLISRQRYWGAPIPVVHCPACGIVPVPRDELPVLLPEGQIDYSPKGRSPLGDLEGFMAHPCPRCGTEGRRDPDTMDTFVCSSWYYLRYADPHNEDRMLSREAADKWLPVDLYIGGIEHACGHLLYSRFICKVLFDRGLLGFDEPFTRLFNHGMVLDAEGAVMSKSVGNVVSPADLLDRKGADVTRLAVFFAAPGAREILWSENAVVGMERFLNRIDTAVRKAARAEAPASDPDKARLTAPEMDLYVLLNRTIRKVTNDIESFEFNTAIASLMELLRDLEASEGIRADLHRFCIECFVRMLAPFTPHFAEEFWQHLGHTGSVFRSEWVEYDDQALTPATITVAVQVNGRLRTTLAVRADTTEDDLKRLSLADPTVAKYVKDREPKKIIVIPGRLVNIVV